MANTVEIEKTDAYGKFLEKFEWANYTAAYPAEAIRTALANLKKHCCTSQKLIDKSYCNNVDVEWKFPQSPYLYDHLVDIGFRRLDAFPDEELRYGLDADPTWKEWRDFITQAAESTEGPTSKEIMEKYNELRTSKKILPVNPTSDELKTVIQSFNDLEQVSLADKYNNICEIMRNIYEAIRADETIKIDVSSNQGYHAACLSLAKKRINEEYVLAKYMMIKKSNELLYDVTKAYMHNYFIQEKLMDLAAVINKVKSLFATMVQQAAPSKKCSQ